jgi:hypothetical protein
MELLHGHGKSSYKNCKTVEDFATQMAKKDLADGEVLHPESIRLEAEDFFDGENIVHFDDFEWGVFVGTYFTLADGR